MGKRNSVSKARPGSVNDRPAQRTCLACGKTFASWGPHNRRCGACDKRVGGLSKLHAEPPTKCE